MASIVQTLPSQHSHPFARHAASPPLDAAHVNPSVQSSQSSAVSEPMVTPVKNRDMAFNMSASFGGTPTGMQPMYSTTATPQSFQQSTSSIYTAQYSNVPVYEMEVNGVIVMKRRSDAWLNATQILKVAGVEKGKRTKVLEKEILSGEHEKVQGGYGKYQGTWINYSKGRDFCRRYGVEDLLLPLLEYDMGFDGQAAKGTVETPTKEQAMAAQRKKMMMNGDIRPITQTPNGTFFKNISSSAVQAIQALTKTRYESNSRPGSSAKRTPTAQRQASQDMQASQQSQASFYSEGSFGINGQLEPFPSKKSPYFSKDRSKGDEPPRKKLKPSGFERDDDEMQTEVNESFAYHQFPQPEQDPSVQGVRPLVVKDSEKQTKLVSLFMDPNQTDFSSHSSLDVLGGEDLDIPIDTTAHTALHWGATLAKPSLMRTLVSKGANIFRVNHGGETALMRAVQTTNNYEQASFSELLDILGPTIETRDNRGRTVLHHIAISSSIRGKSSACRYYLESLLEFVVRQGSGPSSQQNSFADNLVKPKPIGIAKFMTEIVNAQDMMGDTALNIAARNYSKGIIQQLIEVGANSSIPNGGGFKPQDFGVGEEDPVVPASQQTLTSSQRTATADRVAETKSDLMTSLQSLIADTETSFRSELQAKQSLIDKAQSKLREANATLSSERKALAELQQKSNERKDLQNRISNLRITNESNRSHLATTGPPAKNDVSVGDADTGLAIDETLLPLGDHLTPEQEAFLDSLPSADILEARVRAYEKHNSVLEDRKRASQERSSKLEQKLRQLIALSTGTEEDKVDGMLGPLRDAVESEGGEELDYSRLREFLRKVNS